MDYQKIYCALVERARSRILVGTYVECHHVIPRCMGGSDDRANLVELTGREHFIAHHLLVKMHPGIGKLAVSAFLMAARCKTGIKYEKLRKAHSLMMSEMNGGENHGMFGITGAEHHRSRPVVIIETGTQFESCTAAKIWLHKNVNSKASLGRISAACSGGRKSAYGFTWRYAEDTEKLPIDPGYRSGKNSILTGLSGARSYVARAVVIQETGQRFETMAEAEVWLRANGYPRASNSTISKACSGKLKSAFGLHWKFVSD
jgi:hypothetical protein